MILPYLLRIVNAAIQRRDEVLRESHQRLQKQENVGQETEDGVRRFEVCAAVADLVDFDYHEAGYEGGEADVVEDEVGDCAFALLGRSMGRLED